MQIEKKLEYSLFHYPFFFIRLIFSFIKLGQSGFFSLIVNSNLFSKKILFFINIFIMILEKKKLIHESKFLPESLSHLGPGFIKIGQALSTRPDLFGTEITNKLVYLQDALEPFDSNLAIKIIEGETGQKLNKIFKKFYKKPIASASVAQVHLGILISGEKVAVKILRPNIESNLYKDFKFFFWLSKQIEFCKPSLKRFKLPEMIKVFAHSSLNEIDLRLEASSSYELKENFKSYKNYKVPNVIWEYTSKKVLFLEYIKGVRIDKIKNNSKIDINKFTKFASEIFFLQVFRDGFFHADLHPGNIFVNDEEKIIQLDFGIMGRLDNKDRKFLAQLLIYLLEQKFHNVTKLHAEYNMLGANVSHELLTQEIRAISIPILDKPIGEISLAKLLGEILSLSRKFDIKIQPKFCLLQKTMVMAEGIARQINPDANMWKLTKPLLEKWIKDNYDPFNVIQDWIHDNKKIIKEFPELFHKINILIEKVLNNYKI